MQRDELALQVRGEFRDNQTVVGELTREVIAK
jgi:hypothetical protein